MHSASPEYSGLVEESIRLVVGQSVRRGLPAPVDPLGRRLLISDVFQQLLAAGVTTGADYSRALPEFRHPGESLQVLLSLPR